MKTCPHCQREINPGKVDFANHVRWCKENPKAKEYRKGKTLGMKMSQEVCKRMSERVKEAHLRGDYSHIVRKQVCFGHTEETKKRMSDIALASPHRRLKKKMIEYAGVWFDSQWEVWLAQRLHSIGVRWIRPNPIPWMDKENKRHNYFPDFYLVDYKWYLDPKNPFAFKVQKEKVDILKRTYLNLAFLVSEKEIFDFDPNRTCSIAD